MHRVAMASPGAGVIAGDHTREPDARTMCRFSAFAREFLQFRYRSDRTSERCAWVQASMSPRTVVHAVGARPNFIKMAPIIAALDERGDVTQRVVHTGQHYDEQMSAEILSDLELPEPDVFLGIGSGTHGTQTARALEAFEEVLLREPPDLVCVGGDVNSTLAVALAAAKVRIPVAHVEAGLRSYDWTMPEEINRVLTDRLCDILFTHSPEAATNLALEGIDPARVRFVGNTMIDSLRRFEARAEALSPWEKIGLPRGEYVLVTLHRPSNVDAGPQLRRIVAALAKLAAHARVAFPVHPRTIERLRSERLLSELFHAGVDCLEPVGYIDFLGLEIGAGAIVTDSGGVQEEASALGIPCFTLRPNTERPVTIRCGTNTLLGEDPAPIAEIRPREMERREADIDGWDGHAGERAADVIVAALDGGRARAFA
jgi:UDP-N-acetylglucosamine 2-epimerase (non-hydrolysing)